MVANVVNETVACALLTKTIAYAWKIESASSRIDATRKEGIRKRSRFLDMAGKPGFGITRIIDRITKNGDEGKDDERRRLTMNASGVRRSTAVKVRRRCY
jgi:hypothetical protein